MRAFLLLASVSAAGLGAGICLADPNYDVIARGRYLVSAGDCYDCHTADPAKPMAGGKPLQTPFGVIYSANITPDRDTGIGAWSDDQFYRAMHEGISANGSRLYPAFPYPYYTHVDRSDVDAIRAYLKTLEPVANRPPANKLPFPLDGRTVMRGWNWMFFKDAAFRPDGSKSAAWNRGAYLVEGLGHCGACHTPKNTLGGDEKKQALEGGTLQNWVAPDLGPDVRIGLGRWTVEDIVEYLGTGRNRFDNASGPMSEVVRYSTSRLTSSDLRAIATYLKDLPGANRSKPASAQPGSSPSAQTSAGQAIFIDQCAACHRSNGEGIPRMFTPLKGSAAVQQDDPTSVVRVILRGTRSAVTDTRPTPTSMPNFDWKLNDEQIAAVATYIRNSWGNSAPAVAASSVADLRKSLVTSSE